MRYPQTKGLEFEFKDITEEGEFNGHASTFGNKDEGDDIVAEGAFTKDLKRTKGKVPILADHNIREHIGYNKKAEEVKKGLAVEGKLDLNVQRGREKHSLAKMAKELGAKMGLSIGYEVVKKSFDGPVRILEEVKLHEYSFTAFPMNVRAAVGNMKGVEMCVDRPFDSVLLSLAEGAGEIPEAKLEELGDYIIAAINERNGLKAVETDADIRIELRSVTNFAVKSLEQTTLFSKESPVTVIAGHLLVYGAGENDVTAQSLRFLKADGWTKAKAIEWTRAKDFKEVDYSDIKNAVIYLPESIFTSPREMERRLRDVGGFSLSRAKAVASTAFAGLRDVEGDEEAVRQLIQTIKGLDFLPY